MKTKQSLVVLVLFAILQRSDQRETSEQLTETARQKRMVAANNAFSNNINECLFYSWSRYFKNNPIPVLGELAVCKGQSLIGLCYGPPPANVKVKRVAQYAACYNQKTLIPEFTGHIVRPNIGGEGRDNEFRADTGIAPVATDEDYKADQWRLYKNYNSQKQQFFARGHLTPNADFTTEAEREYTMITTNIAPQWQLFNAGNWNNLETALRKYATQTTHALYVFTGTGGAATNFQGKEIKLNGRVVAPKWYWKAVCDPIAKQSVFFFGENTIGDLDEKAMEGKVKGCYDKLQTKRWGVINCYSLNEIKTSKELKLKLMGHFKIPTFHETNCVPSNIGVNFKPFIEKNLV